MDLQNYDYLIGLCVCVCVCGCDGVNEAFSTPECLQVSQHLYTLLSLVESCCGLEILVAMLTDG